SRVAVGDRVCPTFSPGWIAGAPDADAVRRTRGGVVPGVAARSVTVGEGELVRAPAGLSDEAAACLPCAGLTAWTAVIEHGRVRPGHTVLVIGSGGVSTFAVAFARAAGARVFAVTTSADKAERLAGLGVAHVVDRTAEPRWGRAIRAASDGGVDLVVEVGGAGTLAQSLDAVRVGGTVAVIGNLAGAVEPVSVLPILMKQVRCQGVFVGSRRSFESMNAAIERQGIEVQIGARFPFDALPDALAAAAAGVFGKICLTPA
ncbi:MAG: NAD(P)-dependent alcohol dehydrogenase, partial [Myxococcota bacterium]